MGRLSGAQDPGWRHFQCLMKQTSDKLFEAAELKEDERILFELRGQDLIVAEIKYHKSFYGSYTQGRDARLIQQDESKQKVIYEAAFQPLVHYVSKRVIKDLDVMRMADL